MTEDHLFIDGLGNTLAGRDKLRAGWKTERAIVRDGRIAAWRVDCDNQPARKLLNDKSP